MPRPVLSLLQYLRITSTALRQDARTDADLLSRFAKAHDETAFAALVLRHGPMVVNVCRQILSNAQDVDDAFQTTFLVLSQKADKIHIESLAGWLHQVARRSALNALEAANARRRLQKQLQAMACPEAPQLHEIERHEIYQVLHDELAGLSEKLRVPLVLHYLEGKTQSEVARVFGVTERTVRNRLERAKAILEQRLTQRGITVGAAALATLLEASSSQAAVSATLVRRTVEAVLAYRAGTLSGPAAELARQVMKSLPYGMGWMTKNYFVVLMCLGGLGAGAFVWQIKQSHLDGGKSSAVKVKEEASQPKVNQKANQTRLDAYGDPIPEQAILRLGILRLRHTAYNSVTGYTQAGGGANLVVFSHDSKVLVTVGAGDYPQLWDVKTGKLLHKFANLPSGEPIPNGAAALSPDGRLLACISGKKLQRHIDLWDTSTRRRLHRWPCSSSRFTPALVFSADGKTLSAADLNFDGHACHVTVWDVSSGKELRAQQLALDGYNVAFSADGQKLISLGPDRKDRNIVQLWDVTKGKKLLQLSALKDEGNFWSVAALSPDNRFLATTSDITLKNSLLKNATTDGVVHLWDVATGKEVRQIGLDKAGTYSMAFSPNGKFLATGSGGGPIRLWDITTGKEVRSFSDCHSHVISLSFSPDGKLLASGSNGNDYRARIWEVATGKEVSSSFEGHTAPILSLNFTPDGQNLISSGRDGTVRIWDANTGKERCAPVRAGDFQALACLSADGKRIVTAANTFQPDGGNYLATALRSPVHLCEWDAVTGKKRGHLSTKTGWCQSISISPDDKTVATIGIGFPQKQFQIDCSVWDRAANKPIYSNDQKELTSGAFSPDHKTLVVGSGYGDVSLWNVGRDRHLFSTRAHNGIVSCMAFSQDSQNLATAALSRKKGEPAIHLWSFQPITGWAFNNKVKIIGKEKVQFSVLAFSPDCKTLAAAGEDGTVYLWEIATGQERCQLKGYQGQIWTLAFAPDGRRLASGMDNSTILIWDITGRLDQGKLPPVSLSAKDLKLLWSELAVADAARAGHAIWTLVASASSTVPFFQTHLRPERQSVSAESLVKLIGDLDADVFGVRKKARKQLETFGAVAEPELRKALGKKPSMEKRRTLLYLLALIEEKRTIPSGDVLRALRAVEILEQIGTLEACQLLEKLSIGAPGARQTQEAKASLARMTKRTAPK